MHNRSRFRYHSPSANVASSVLFRGNRILGRPKSGKTALALAHAMIQRVYNGLLPTEEAIASELDRALKVLAPYRNDRDLKSSTRDAR